MYVYSSNDAARFEFDAVFVLISAVMYISFTIIVITRYIVLHVFL